MQYTTAVLPFLYAVANGAVHTIEVGDNGMTFEPQTIAASSGDTVIFELHENHDVIQGDFGSPCTPSSNGFYSGPYSDTDNGDKRFVVNITSSDPIYFYCGVQRHCQSGMVGGINVPSNGDTIQSYSDAARNVQQAETPNALRGGQLIEEDRLESLTSALASATGSAPSGSSSPSGASTTTNGAQTSSGTGPSSSAGGAQSTGLAVGVVAPGQLGGFAAAALGVAAWFV